MNTCPTVKEVSIPGCYTGVLKVNTGLEPGTTIDWNIQKEASLGYISASTLVDSEGNITLTIPTSLNSYLSYFDTYKLYFKQAVEDQNIKGYDCYRLMPFKNTDEVVDVVI